MATLIPPSSTLTYNPHKRTLTKHTRAIKKVQPAMAYHPKTTEPIKTSDEELKNSEDLFNDVDRGNVSEEFEKWRENRLREFEIKGILGDGGKLELLGKKNNEEKLNFIDGEAIDLLLDEKSSSYPYIEELEQFITETVQKTQQKTGKSSQISVEMEKNPLELLQLRLEERKELKKTLEANHKKNQSTENLHHSEHQHQHHHYQLDNKIKEYQELILAKIAQHHEKRTLTDKITQLEEEIQTEMTHYQNLYNNELKEHQSKISFPIKEREEMMNKTEEMLKEMEWMERKKMEIERIKSKIVQKSRENEGKREMLKVEIEQMAGKRMHKELLGENSGRREGECNDNNSKKSNKEIVQEMFDSLSTKTNLITKAIEISTDRHSFTTYLQTLNLTSSTLESPESPLSLDPLQPSYLPYPIFFSSQPEILHLYSLLEEKHNKLNSILTIRRKEINKIKEESKAYEKKIGELENMEKIREAEEKEMRKILEGKVKQLGG